MRLFTFFTLVLFCISATAKQYSIDDFVGVEIRIDNGWAGESLKLEKPRKGIRLFIPYLVLEFVYYPRQNTM